MDLPEEHPLPTLETTSKSEPDDLNDSNTASESEASQDTPSITQPVAPVASETPTQDGDSDFTGQLNDHEEREITSHFVGDIYITFDTQDENMRAQSSVLPRNFYRTFYETSATLSSYVTVDTHVKHRKRTDLKIDNDNAFQAIGEFSIRKCMFLEAIQRHLTWNQKRIPSSYISAFNHIRNAKIRADFHFNKSQRIGQRVSIAKIHTKHLIPATIRGLCKSTIRIFGKNYPWTCMRSKVYTKQVEIPVWIHKKAKEKYGTRITPEQRKESGADMWMSTTELQASNFGTVHPKIPGIDRIHSQERDYEWLCCGAIPKALVVDVWPWVGEKLYTTDPGHPIRSFQNSGQTWVWNWEKRMWLPDTFSASATATQFEGRSNKRQRIDDAASENEDESADCECSKNRQILSMSIIHSVIEIQPDDFSLTRAP